MKVTFKTEEDTIDGKEVDFIVTTEGLDNLNFVNIGIDKKWYIVPLAELYECVKLFNQMRAVCYEKGELI